MTTELMIVVMVGLTVMAVFGAAFMFWRQYDTSKSLDQRLDRLTGQASPTAESGSILREPMYPEDATSFVEKMLPKLPNMTIFFEQASFRMSPGKFWTITAIAAVVGAALPIGLGWHYLFALLVAPVFGSLLFIYVFYRRKQRLSKFGAQLCEALELVARALRAGHSLAAAMHTVAEEMPEPIATEFGRVFEEQNLGIGIEQAMRSLGNRVPNLDLKFFVTAVIIQRQTGGDLAEILDKIGYVIRERFKILGMVKALTGEGRISGVVLIGLPFVLLLMMMRISYEYVSMLWTHPLGQMMSAVGLVLIVLGALVIRYIINIKI